MKQKTSIEFTGTEGRRLRAQMEQTLTHYDVNDVYKAIECLLDAYGGKDIDVLQAVKHLLIFAAYKRFRLQKDAASFLGRHRYSLNYQVFKMGALENAKKLLDFAAKMPVQIEGRIEQEQEEGEENANALCDSVRGQEGDGHCSSEEVSE